MRKQSLIIIVAIVAGLVVAGAFFLNQELIVKHIYPQDALHRDANLAVRSIVASVEAESCHLRFSRHQLSYLALLYSIEYN